MRKTALIIDSFFLSESVERARKLRSRNITFSFFMAESNQNLKNYGEDYGICEPFVLIFVIRIILQTSEDFYKQEVFISFDYFAVPVSRQRIGRQRILRESGTQSSLRYEVELTSD